ncbi:glycosyltransferase family 2 protein [Curtobacterium sp. VKM Ac-2922]|uniref:glycosyltransferase family 2 protein n=1 Tax=Curtobacterium sp. VKM Ac-2922 TaxID=2929475 RepID=UPI001FB29FD0|nr:glycosyltransferase family 2 protein [Curtobacterium sp. VKM Ac-2922]MCJ1713344.1 glycosyltransferase family 2 protein [Curtobacterium sp. VKM Ac-2922]
MQPSSAQPRVTAVLVVANGADHLDRTLAALASQTRHPDNLVVVDVGSTDGSTAELEFGGSAQLTRIPAGRSFGDAVAVGEQAAPHPESDESVDEWLWLVGHDNAPAPTALAEMLAAVEIAPSVAVAGPKLTAVDDPSRIRAFGESMTRFGRSLVLVQDELDQGQHDRNTDVMAVAAGGMLVRRSVWKVLGGFDPALPDVDAALDFCVRVRLAGHRVAVVPDARATTAGPIEEFGRKRVSEARRVRLHRQAQLHRRMTYAPAGLLWLHWLTLVPFAVGRAVGHLVAKHPAAVSGELAAAFAVAFGGGTARSRTALARSKRLGWAAVEPLRISWRRVHERRTTSRDVELARVEDAPLARASFLGDGGIWVVLAAALLSVVTLFPLLGSPALTGGGLLPLSTSVAQLWQNVGYGWHSLGTGFTGPSDPFAAVLAVLGSIVFWSPSTAVVVVVLLAFPVSALGAWFVVRKLTTRMWVPVIGAALYTIAPTLVGAVTTGHLGAVIAHVLLPWLFLTVLEAHRSWASASGAALLFAAVAASAPSLLPVLLIGWLVALAAGWRHAHRRVFIPVPAAVLFVPLVLTQVARGNLLGVFADPGVPSATRAPSALQLAIGQPLPDWNGWLSASSPLDLVAAALPVALAVLALPIAATAIGAVLGHRWSVAGTALLAALLGFATAFAATHVTVTGVGSTTTIVWPGSGLSVYWLAIVVAACIGVDTVPRQAPVVGLVATVFAGVAVAPAFAAFYLGTAVIQPTTGRVLSAYVNAEAQANPDVGTLVVEPQSDGSLAVSLERGQGSTLDDQSTLDATALSLSPSGSRLATLAGNLASRSGYDPEPALRELGISFVLLDDASDDALAQQVHDRAAGAIGQDARFTSIGDTTNGQLFHYDGTVDRTGGGSSASKATHALYLVVLGVVFGAAALLAVPTAPRRRRATSNVLEADEPATTFDEERDE